MRFKGDIIITDPCYIIMRDEEYKDLKTRPKWDDFHTVKHDEDRNKFMVESKLMNKAVKEWAESNPDHWEKCEYGENMEALGINDYLCRDTLNGDWSCTTYNDDTEEVIGEFCADAGLVAVFLLDDVLKYNPKFDHHTEKKWTTSLIRDFDGEINIVFSEYERTDCNGLVGRVEEVRVIGKGNVNFYTTQTRS